MRRHPSTTRTDTLFPYTTLFRSPPSSARLYCTCEEKSAEEGSAMTDWPEKTLADWRKLATEELKGADADCLTWQTPEGIAVKPLYTAEDLEGLATVGSLPGFAPFTRGPKATMYAGRPWTLRQYAGFSTAEESNAFYRANLAGG